MKYLPTVVAQEDLDIAGAPYLGGEFAVMVATKPAVLLGKVEMSGSGTGAGAASNGLWTANQATAVVGAAADLQITCKEDLESPTAAVVTFNVVDDLGATATASATFAPPSRVADQSGQFAAGYAMDLTVSTGAARKVASITGLASITGGNRGMVFRVYQLPEAADYELVGETTSKKFNTKARQPVGIDSGMESDAFVKRGKTAKGDLTIDSKFGGMASRLSRYSGKKMTAMLVGLKDGVLTCDRLVFTQYVPIVGFDVPDGDGEAMENAATGKFVDHLFFVAP